jgi:16S rRNA (cytosine967-C5)-methyltransferase
MCRGYALDREGLIVGSPILGDEVLSNVRVQADLSMLNRHGLIAGATGTGKTKSLQLLAGQLSEQGLPCFVADVKGDLTGLAAPGDGRGRRATKGPQADRRAQKRSTGTLIKEGVRFARSRLGQQILRSVFGTLFGKKR